MSAEDMAAGRNILVNVQEALQQGAKVSVYLRGRADPLSVTGVMLGDRSARIEGSGAASYEVAYSAIEYARYTPEHGSYTGALV